MFLRYLLIFVLFLSFSEAKKSSWGGSKRGKSRTTHLIKKTKKSSFTQAREKKLAKERAKKSFNLYKAKHSSTEDKIVTTTQKSNIDSQNHINLPTQSFQQPHQQQPQHQTTIINSNNNYSNNYNHSTKGGSSIVIIMIIIGAFGILYFIFFKKAKENKKRIKENLPIDLRIGAIVDLSAIETRFITNRENYKFQKPESLKGYVTSIGEVILDEDLKVYNLYISKNIDEKNHIFYIKFEIFKNRISNIKFFIEYEEINPSTVEEWEEWLDGTNDLYPNIGGIDFKTPDDITYNRVWEPEIDEVVRSKFIEKFSFDEHEKETLNMTSLYGREFANGDIEYLYVLNIEDSELNNFIRIDLGIEINENELQIL